MKGVDWMDDAACSPEQANLFHPEGGTSTAKAKAVCDGCPVKAECQSWSLGERWMMHTVVGGLDGLEREKLRGYRATLNA